MLESILIVSMLQGFSLQSEGIHCSFPPTEPNGKTMEITLDPMPSLKDQPGLYRVIMTFGGDMSFKAAAQPIASTEERDILILAKYSSSDVVSLGVRDDGAAALTLRKTGMQTEEVQPTRVGACKGAAPHINRWLPY